MDKLAYITTAQCARCGKMRSCKWMVTGAFRGVWCCLECELDDDALADIVKAAHRKLAELEGNDGSAAIAD